MAVAARLGANAARIHGKAGWAQRHLNDPYVKQAVRLGYRSRAAIKLVQMDAKLKVLRPGEVALDLGAAPGSWSQVLAERRMDVVALDELPMDPVAGCMFVRGSITSGEARDKLLAHLAGRPVDLVLSDISPPRSGHHSLDHCRLVSLLVSVLELARQVLRPGGGILAKALQGEDHARFMRVLARFGKISQLKPKASRTESVRRAAWVRHAVRVN
mmetsp:Transcript_8789/g.26035  ORF Transcript_8789/g.26035 Transcript_8789/m.26035 type:complete len:215 (-) Transcript_8789:1045-1689(-)